MLSIDTIALNCLVFEKIAFVCILATDRLTDRQTDGQHRKLSRSRGHERRLNKVIMCFGRWRREIGAIRISVVCGEIDATGFGPKIGNCFQCVCGVNDNLLSTHAAYSHAHL